MGPKSTQTLSSHMYRVHSLKVSLCNICVLQGFNCNLSREVSCGFSTWCVMLVRSFEFESIWGFRCLE